MARPSKVVKKIANLHCNNCGEQFPGRVWFESVETDEGGTLSWRPLRGGAREVTCPLCESTLIRVLD